MQVQSPTVGRIVNVVLKSGAAGGFRAGEIRPMIVTAVWPEGRVNGHIFLDGRNDDGHDDHAYTAAYDETGKTHGSWHWPARG